MLEQGYITQEEHDAAVAEELNFDNGKATQATTSTYTWYEDAVIQEVLQDLQDTYDWSEEYAKGVLYNGGLQIYTCLDMDVQAAVDEIYGNRENLNYTSATGQDIQSAITVINNETGEVVAMAGGIGQKTTSLGWNRATKTVRPPGSSIKPLAVYAPAIELGIITPNSTYEDSPYDKDGWPVNATGRYQGMVSVAKAVRESINTVAVKVLADVTPETSYEFMQDRFHIKLVESLTKNGKNYTDIALAPLALGGLTEGVSTYEMAAAYSVFPRMGVYKEPRTYSIVLDANKKIMLDNTQETNTVLSQRTAYYMNSMLMNVVSGPSGATGRNAYFSGQDIAGKTGTTTSRKDLWFVGYTPYYTAAVWTGYDQQEKLASYMGNPSTNLWKQVMQKIHEDLPYKSFEQPDTSQMTTVNICSVSGKLPNSYCSGHVVSESFFPEDVPTETCTVHRYVAPAAPSENGSGETGEGDGGTGETTPPGGETTSPDGGTTTPDTGTTTPTPGTDTPPADATTPSA